MPALGYSTGAIALGDFGRALHILATYNFKAVELSALRMHEVEPLLRALPSLELSQYDYISFHAPSAFSEDEEDTLIDLLSQLPESWPIVVHPDAIYNFHRWQLLSPRLAIENMDTRKFTGRSVRELSAIFERLPNARMCLDLGHARQVDSSMVGAFLMLKDFASRIVQLHISEVDTMSRHDMVSIAAEMAFAQVRQFIPASAAFIVESCVAEQQIDPEMQKIESIFFPLLP